MKSNERAKRLYKKTFDVNQIYFLNLDLEKAFDVFLKSIIWSIENRLRSPSYGLRKSSVVNGWLTRTNLQPQMEHLKGLAASWSCMWTPSAAALVNHFMHTLHFMLPWIKFRRVVFLSFMNLPAKSHIALLKPEKSPPPPPLELSGHIFYCTFFLVAKALP